MKPDEVKRRYQAAEGKADSLLGRLGDSPWTLAAVIAALLGAFVLGAWLF